VSSARVCLALALATGCVTALAAYPVLRAWQVIVVGEANPVTVLTPVHMAFFWRAWTSAYVGGMGAFVGYFAARRDSVRLARALSRAIIVVATVLAVQAVFLP